MTLLSAEVSALSSVISQGITTFLATQLFIVLSLKGLVSCRTVSDGISLMLVVGEELL